MFANDRYVTSYKGKSMAALPGTSDVTLFGLLRKGVKRIDGGYLGPSCRDMPAPISTSQVDPEQSCSAPGRTS
jgi:hypothetical protein